MPRWRTPKRWSACCATRDRHRAGLRRDTRRRARQYIDDFRAGRLRCLVTVLALATGFDVPDVDLHPVASTHAKPGAVRARRWPRNANRGRQDRCLWLDFSDTTERLGPVDAIKGPQEAQRRSGPGRTVCDLPGMRRARHAGQRHVLHRLRREDARGRTEPARKASNAAIMAHQIAPDSPTPSAAWNMPGIRDATAKPDSMRVDYYSGLRRVASEWVCFEHGGFAQRKGAAVVGSVGILLSAT